MPSQGLLRLGCSVKLKSMNPYFAVVPRGFFGLDGLAVVTGFEMDSSSAIDVRVVNCVGHSVVVEDFKGSTLDAGLQIEHFSDRPVGVNHVSSVASIPIKEIEVQTLSGLRKKLNKGMAEILVEDLHDYGPLGVLSYSYNRVLDVHSVLSPS